MDGEPGGPRPIRTARRRTFGLAPEQQARYARDVRRLALGFLYASMTISCSMGAAYAPSEVEMTGVPVVKGSTSVVVVPPSEPPPPEPAVAPEAMLPPRIVEAAAKLTEAAAGDTTGWDRLAYMADTFGHRLSGSDGLEATIDWTVATMASDGLSDARREPVMVKRWVRGEESARMVAPREKELYMLGLGNSVGTPRRGVKAPVVMAADLEGVDALGDAARGKIVAVTKAMPAYDFEEDTSRYGETVQPRLHAASRAARLGAKAVLIRSVTARDMRLPHTGTLVYDEDAPKIPAAALSPEDMMFLERMAQRGQEVTVELKMGAKTLPDRESANAVAELRGREKPEEIVVIGCHIDAWDVGDGAHDDGGGCVMAMEAGRVLHSLGLQPRRTIRVVLFTNEENGGAGGRAYFEAHGGEPHVGAIEADSGTFAPKGFGIGSTEAELAAMAPFAPLFEGLGADLFKLGGGGADIGPLVRAGVLGVAVRPEGSTYFDLHHTAADTVDKVDPEHLQRNAMAMALMAFILAERDLPEGTVPVIPKDTAAKPDAKPDAKISEPTKDKKNTKGS